MDYDAFEKILKEENETIIVLDTNIILALAKYSLYSSKKLLELLYYCNELLWIPNQVFKEYNANKHKIFGDIKKRFEKLEKNLLEVNRKNGQKLRSALENSIKYNYLGIEKMEKALLGKTDELDEIIKSYKDTIGDEYLIITQYSGEIIGEIEKFVSDLKENNQIGEKISFRSKIEIIRQGEIRYKYKIPPGYKDDNKDGVEKFGDLFVWKEILELPAHKPVKNIIFVTDDLKNDWWKETKEKELVIRDELLTEFSEINPNAFIDFIELGKFQIFASKLFNFNDFEFFVDLNRNDMAYIERIDQNLYEMISDEIISNPDSYLYSADYIGEIIEDVNIFDCGCNNILNTFINFKEDSVDIIYELEYFVDLDFVSYDCWGHDEDTREPIISSPLMHEANGRVIVRITRSISKEQLDEDYSYIFRDNELKEFEILDVNIDEVTTIGDGEFYEDLYF